MNAAEHFEWARQRAMEYVDAGDGGSAMSSMIVDLANHPGTANILDGLETLFMGEVMLGGAEGARRFINGIPAPYVAEDAES
jgi:hypothetical protein